ncbi:hypothetical protein D1BOALGB6SA_4220 [Olavius sp. associated proteobacterium Delta 1]|nr:hypothetical protein D1BOALGB6SA_4220 [Olavius sp. associated proteobacterium Delta 1]
MNREIEFHDSTLREIKINEGDAVLCFDETYVHHSEGTPGISKGTGWAQKIDLICKGAKVLELPDDLPNDIDYGYFIINGDKSENMMKLPFKTESEIEIVLITQYGKKAHLIAKTAFTKEIGQAKYIEDFP